MLAIVSVGLGVAQLLAMAWFERRLPRPTAVAWEGAFFLAYLALVAGMLWRYQHRMRAAAPKCPSCGARLEGLSERVAIATGKCDSCGGQVLE